MIAITGASGQLGRSVAEALYRLVPPSTVTLGSRHPAKSANFAAKGFRTTVADFDRPETLEAAFAGADVVLIICGDASNEVRIPQHRAAIDAAKKAGVARIVYTSFVNPTKRSCFPFAVVHEDSEAYIRSSDLNYTFLRNNQYIENLNSALADAKVSGTLSLPGAGGKVAYISRADVAAATAGALIQGGHENKSYEVTGPEALDLFEIAKILEKVWNRPVVAEEMSAEKFRDSLTARGLPAYLVDAQIGVRRASGAGEYSSVSEDARMLAGRAIETLQSYLVRMC